MFYIAEMQLRISINQLTSLEEMGECASAASEQHKCPTEGGSILTSFGPAKKGKMNSNLHVQKAALYIQAGCTHCCLEFMGLMNFCAYRQAGR